MKTIAITTGQILIDSLMGDKTMYQAFVESLAQNLSEKNPKGQYAEPMQYACEDLNDLPPTEVNIHFANNEESFVVILKADEHFNAHDWTYPFSRRTIAERLESNMENIAEHGITPLQTAFHKYIVRNCISYRRESNRANTSHAFYFDDKSVLYIREKEKQYEVETGFQTLAAKYEHSFLNCTIGETKEILEKDETEYFVENHSGNHWEPFVMVFTDDSRLQISNWEMEDFVGQYVEIERITEGVECQD